VDVSEDIRLIGPGGADTSLIGAVLAAHLEVPFVDLNPHLFAGSETSASTSTGTDTTHTLEENVETYS
jgi:shikimate kinase